MNFSGILLLEDSPLDAELAIERLCNAGIGCEVRRVSSRAEFVAALDDCPFDVILADFELPGFDGLSALQIAREKCPQTPFIFVSGKLGEENAVDSLRLGATDYVLKQRIDRLAPAVFRAVAEARERSERQRAEQAAWENEQRLRQAVAIAKLGTFEIDLATDAVQLNEPGRAIYGWKADEQITFSKVQAHFHPDDRDEVLRLVRSALDPGGPGEFEVEQRILRTDGAIRWIRVNGRALFVGGGSAPRRATRLIGAYIDSTDQKVTEQSLRDNERRFREMADTAPAMLWVTSADGQCTFVSRGWQVFSGQTQEEALGSQWMQMLHPQDLDRCRDTIRDAHVRREPFDVDCRIRRPDGSYRWVVDSGRPRWIDGRYIGHVGSVIDVDDRKRAEAMLSAEKQVLEQIATGKPVETVLDTLVRGVEAQSTDSLICSVLLVSEDGKRLIHGAAPNLPAPYCRAIDGLGIEPGASCCAAAAYERRAVTVEDTASHPLWAHYRNIAAEHGLRSCYVLPVLASNGSVLGTVAIYYRRPHAPSDQDRRLVESAAYLAGITIERKRADQVVRTALEAERRARAAAERESHVKDEFLATLSHELRTPLNAILGWTQIIGGRRVSEEDVQEGLRVVERNARTQAQLIEDLLDMSRIVSGKIRLDVLRLDLVEVIESACATVRPSADAKRIELVNHAVATPAGGAWWVLGDQNRLQQVFWNLISNAVKFTPAGGRVEIELAEHGKHIEVLVRDTGEGIAPEFLQHVFDRFRQADGSTTRRHGGLGLGLSIVKSLVELHGGSVHAQSAGRGHGASFMVRLPMAGVRAGIDPPGNRPRDPVTTSPIYGDGDPDWTGADPRLGLDGRGERQLEGMTVLIVDDDADARELMRRVFEQRGAKVLLAGDARTGFDILRDARPAVVVSDIGMPGEDGYAFMRRVRALPPTNGGGTPAIALTAFARSEDSRLAIAAGFQVHLPKPAEPSELVSIVQKLAAPLEDQALSAVRSSNNASR